jgi:(2Fe-2S) ferredoxin
MQRIRSAVVKNEKPTPFTRHVFVCINGRGGVRKSCADGDSLSVRAALKEEVKNRGWKPAVRVSQAGCLGLCEEGPNVLIYPQKIWFKNVSAGDVDPILEEIGKIVQQEL